MKILRMSKAGKSAGLADTCVEYREFLFVLGDLRNVVILVPLDQHAYHFHERCQWMRFIFANQIDELIENGNKALIFSIYNITNHSISCLQG